MMNFENPIQAIAALPDFFSVALAWLIALFSSLFVFAIIVLIGWFATKYIIALLKKVLEKTQIDSAANAFLCSVVKVILLSITALIAAPYIGINITTTLAALGAVGLTAGFALQGSLSNFVSGLIIIFSKPFKSGDFLEVQGFTGTVKEITFLNTTLITPDNKETIVPNSKLTSDVVVNFTSQTSRRLDLSYGIDYTSNIDLAKTIVHDIAKSCATVIQSKDIVTAVGKHQDSSVEIIAQVWVAPADYWKTYFFMQEEVKKAFDKNAIQIPFPQLDVHTK